MLSQLPLFTAQQERLPSISSPAEPPVSPTPSPVVKKVRKTRDTSGQKCAESLPNSGPLGFFSRMFLTLSARLPTRYSEIFKTSDTNAGRSCTALRVSERRTGEKDSSLWPTPAASNFNDGQSVESWMLRKARELSKRYNGNGAYLSLDMATRMEEAQFWATATNEDGECSGRRPNKPENAQPLNVQVKTESKLRPGPNSSDSKGARRSTAKKDHWTSKDGETLLDTVLSENSTSSEEAQQTSCSSMESSVSPSLWASPVARNAHGAKGAACKAEHAGQDLVSQAREAELWATPRESEWKGVGPLDSKSQAYRLEKNYLDAQAQHAEQKTGALNPDWVEQLMGFPDGWTRVDGPLSEECSSMRGSIRD